MPQTNKANRHTDCLTVLCPTTRTSIPTKIATDVRKDPRCSKVAAFLNSQSSERDCCTNAPCDTVRLQENEWRDVFLAQKTKSCDWHHGRQVGGGLGVYRRTGENHERPQTDR
jgi:hypothetical protein